MQRVALVGSGNMGRVHASVYAELPSADFVAVCDINPETAQAVGEQYSIPWFTDFNEMVSKVEFDVVDICTPTPAHLDCIKAASAAGKHVSCEKPMARTVGQAQEAARVCEEAGVTLFIAHVLRWFPEYRRIHDMTAEGTVGNVVEVRSSRGGGHPGPADCWYTDYRKSGGVVLDLIIHDFDWLRWCFGKVRRVYARGLAESKIPMTDYALVTIRFESGVIAHVEGVWARPSGFNTSVEVAGSKGLLDYSFHESVPLVIERKVESGAGGGVTIPESPTSVNPYYQEIEHFIACLDEGKTPDVTPEDGIEAVRISEAALRSISSGQPVILA